MRLIDADALGIGRYNPDVFPNTAYAAGWNGVINIIQSSPTIDAAPVVHGHWVEDEDTQTCSNCGEEHEWGDYRASFCDTCGAKMDGKEALCYEKIYKRNQGCDLMDEKSNV